MIEAENRAVERQFHSPVQAGVIGAVIDLATLSEVEHQALDGEGADAVEGRLPLFLGRDATRGPQRRPAKGVLVVVAQKPGP